MEAVVIWKDGMAFDGRAEGFSVPMDATTPLGHHNGPNPKRVFLASLAACAGMDVIGLLKRDHQFIDSFKVESKVPSSSHRHPIIFDLIELVFHLEGSIEIDAAIRAVELSQTKYCGMSAMICETVPIQWTLVLNGEKVADGRAAFKRVEDDAFQTSYEG